MKKTLICVFSLLSCCFANADTILTVEYLDGSEKKEQLEKLSKIVFDQNGNMTFDYNSGDTKSFGNLSNTQKIVFSDGVLTNVASHPLSASIQVVPNPASENISINGMQEGDVVKVYTMVGSLVLTSQEPEINVAGLADGQYIITVGNSVIKLIKKN